MSNMMAKIRTLDPILIELLSHSDEFHSGEKIAQELNISRAAVHKKIDKLRQYGFQINAFPHKGFQLKKPYPFNIFPEEIYHRVQTQNCPPIYFIEQCSSTNNLAHDLLLSCRHPFFLFARDQNKGKGRAGRTWNMQPDQDIVMSFATPIELVHDQLFSLIRMSSLAVVLTLNQLAFGKFQIKWPNDIICADGRKICGILTESIFEDNKLNYAVIGIGLNVNSVSLPHYAVSLRMLADEIIDINLIIAQLIDNLLLLWKNFPDNTKTIISQWNNFLAWKGEEVVLALHDDEIHGVFVDVMDDGALILNVNNQQQRFFTGDLTGVKLRKKNS